MYQSTPISPLLNTKSFKGYGYLSLLFQNSIVLTNFNRHHNHIQRVQVLTPALLQGHKNFFEQRFCGYNSFSFRYFIAFKLNANKAFVPRIMYDFH